MGDEWWEVMWCLNLSQHNNRLPASAGSERLNLECFLARSQSVLFYTSPLPIGSASAGAAT